MQLGNKKSSMKNPIWFSASRVFFFGWPIQVTFNGLAEEKPSIRPNCQYPAMSYVAEPFYFLFPVSDVILTIPTSWHVKLLFISNAIFIFHWANFLRLPPWNYAEPSLRFTDHVNGLIIEKFAGVMRNYRKRKMPWKTPYMTAGDQKFSEEIFGYSFYLLFY